MNREDDLKNLWKELREISEAKDDAEDKAEEAPAPKETVELDALLSRLEDIVSRLEEAYGKKDDTKEDKEEAKDEKKEEEYIPRRIRRPLRGRE